MHYCDGCHFPIIDPDNEERRRWCRSIRGILKLEDAQPENYHEKCFVDLLLKENKQPSTQRRGEQKSMPTHSDSPSHPWVVRGG